MPLIIELPPISCSWISRRRVHRVSRQAHRVSRQQADYLTPNLVVPWLNRPFVAREVPILHVIGITVDDKLPDKDILLAV